MIVIKFTTDVYAVAIVEGDTVVGHVPRSISAVCYLFITRGGTIVCEIIDSIGLSTIYGEITGARQYFADLPQGGLELPCKLLFYGSTKDIT